MFLLTTGPSRLLSGPFPSVHLFCPHFSYFFTHFLQSQTCSEREGSVKRGFGPDHNPLQGFSLIVILFRKIDVSFVIYMGFRNIQHMILGLTWLLLRTQAPTSPKNCIYICTTKYVKAIIFRMVRRLKEMHCKRNHLHRIYTKRPDK